MNKERMKNILDMIHSESTELTEREYKSISECFVNHPEIEAMFESENGINVVYTDGEYGECWYCTECGAGEVDEESSGHKEDCWHCGVELIWPTDRSEAQYEVFEETYEIFDIQDTAFEKDDPVCDYIGDCVVGSEFCFKLCKTNDKRNFVGNEIEGESIRCAYRFNKGATK